MWLKIERPAIEAKKETDQESRERQRKDLSRVLDPCQGKT